MKIPKALTESRQAQIEEALKLLHAEKNALIEAEARRNISGRLPKLVGKCFIYKANSYSMSKSTWSAFCKVIYVGDFEAGYAIHEHCQIDSNGQPTITLECSFTKNGSNDSQVLGLSGGWQPCTAKQYAKARAATIAQLLQPNLFKKHLNRR